jgi:hypothetical protein
LTIHAPLFGELQARRPFQAEAIVGKDAPPLWLVRLAVHLMPGSVAPTELLAAAAVDAAGADSAARQLLDGTNRHSDRQDAYTPTARRRSAVPT